MTIEIRRHIVAPHIADKVTYKGTNTKRYIVIHETDNTNKGANADAHGRLQANGNSRAASWHYSVDDKEVVQSFSDDAQCWAAGNQHYNKHGIQIEMCVNSDGNYKKTVENTVALVKKLMKKYNIPVNRVLQHYDASNKNCPRNLRSGAKGITWSDFQKMITGGKTVKAKKTQPTSTSSKKANMTTNSIVEYLDSIDVDSSYSNRSKLAKQYDIKNYKGTASQNLSLLAKLREGNTKTSSKPKQSTSKPKTTNRSIAQMAQEVIDGKHGVGHSNRQKSLGISTADYEKVRAEVNRILSGKKATTKVKTKSISQMASEILAGKHGNGHEQRRKSLGIDKATYEKVRAEVNRRSK